MNYVSPPIEQYLKFKNRCSLVYINQLKGKIHQEMILDTGSLAAASILYPNLILNKFSSMLIIRCSYLGLHYTSEGEGVDSLATVVIGKKYKDGIGTWISSMYYFTRGC